MRRWLRRRWAIWIASLWRRCGRRTSSRRFRSEEHTSELQSHSDLHSFPTRRSSDLATAGAGGALDRPAGDAERARVGGGRHAHRRARAAHRASGGCGAGSGGAGRSGSPACGAGAAGEHPPGDLDRKSTRLNSSHTVIYTLSLHDALPILQLPEQVVHWIARRVTQNVRELEGAVTRIGAHVQLTGLPADAALAQAALGDLDRQLVAPVRPENILQAICNYFGLEHKVLRSGRRQRTISLARSVAMFLIRKTAKLSFPEIGVRMGKRNHSTVISACRRIEKAANGNERLIWTSSVGDREEEATELLQRLEEQSRALCT